MDLSQYRGNSNASKDIQNVPEERERIEQIASGRKVKPSFWRSALSDIIADDLSVIGTKILKEIVIPSFKNAISDGITNTVDILLWGQTRGHSGYSGSNTIRRITPYSSLYSGNTSNKVVKYNEPQQAARGLDRYSYQDILIPFVPEETHSVTKSKADAILARMRVYLDRYGFVSVGDLYDAVGEVPDRIDQDWGWYNLDSAYVQNHREGFILRMPTVESIK